MIAATALAISPPVPPTTWEQDVAIAGGIIYGLTGAEQLTDLSNCMHDADIFAFSLLHAWQLVSEGDMRGRIAGMRLVTNVIQDFPSYIKDCEASGDDVVQFGLWFEEFIHPVNLVETVFYNAEHHARQLTKDILYTRSFLN